MLALLVVAGGAVGAARAQPPARVVVLPFENLSGTATIGRDVAALMAAALPERGWRLADADNVEALLEDERVRYLDSLTPPQLARLVDATGAEAVLFGSVTVYDDGPNAMVAVGARLVDRGGSVRWWDLEAASAEDTVGVLGLGRAASARDLARVVVQRLAGRAPGPGDTRAIATEGAPMFLARPIAWRSPYLPRDDSYRVVILPLEGWVGSGAATKVVAGLLARRLEATGHFHVVEPAVVRRALLELGLWSVGGLDPDALRLLGERLGAPYFVRGTLFRFSDGRGQNASPPRVELTLTMVDARRERLVWIGHHARGGDDYRGLLELGSVTTAVALADRVVAELVEASEASADRGQALKSVPRRARTEERAGERTAAAAAPRSPRKLTPEQELDARTHVQQGLALADAGRTDEAVAELAKAIELTDDARLYFPLGSIHDRARRTQDALAAYRRYVAEANVGPKQKAPVLRRIKALEASAAPAAGAEAETDPPATQPAESEPAPPSSRPVADGPALTLTERQQRKVGERLAVAERAEKAKQYEEALAELRSVYLVTHDPELLARMQRDAERSGRADLAARIRAEVEALADKDPP
jgi:tetratricopeptide (TPR) repeat protein